MLVICPFPDQSLPSKDVELGPGLGHVPCATSLRAQRLRIGGRVAARMEIETWYYQRVDGTWHKMHRGILNRIVSRMLLQKYVRKRGQGTKSIQTGILKSPPLNSQIVVCAFIDALRYFHTIVMNVFSLLWICFMFF